MYLNESGTEIEMTAMGNRGRDDIRRSDNLRRAQLPSCLLIPAPEGGLAQDSVALWHQIRALDRDRLVTRLSQISDAVLAELERVVASTLGMFSRQRER